MYGVFFKSRCMRKYLNGIDALEGALLATKETGVVHEVKIIEEELS